MYSTVLEDNWNMWSKATTFSWATANKYIFQVCNAFTASASAVVVASMLVANCWPVANLISFNNAVALVSASVADAATLDDAGTFNLIAANSRPADVKRALVLEMAADTLGWSNTCCCTTAKLERTCSMAANTVAVAAAVADAVVAVVLVSVGIEFGVVMVSRVCVKNNR